MRRIDGIRATGSQRLSTTAYNGDIVVIVLSYQAAIQEWKIDIEWEDFILKGSRVYSALNMFCQYMNIIPFGIGITTDGGGEPFLVNDFSSGRVNMYLLSEDEIQEIQDYYVSLRDEG